MCPLNPNGLQDPKVEANHRLQHISKITCKYSKPSLVIRSRSCVEPAFAHSLQWQTLLRKISFVSPSWKISFVSSSNWMSILERTSNNLSWKYPSFGCPWHMEDLRKSDCSWIRVSESTILTQPLRAYPFFPFSRWRKLVNPFLPNTQIDLNRPIDITLFLASIEHFQIKRCADS